MKNNSQEVYSEYFNFLLSCLEEMDLPQFKIALCKSIGTRIVASNRKKEMFSEIIWLTPAIKDEFVFAEMRRLANKSLFVIGSVDPFCDQSLVSMLQESGAKSRVIENADHGLDIEGEPEKSILEMKGMLTWIKEKSVSL